MRCRQQELKLGSRDEVFDTFLKLHPKLKEQFFLNTKEEESDPYESSQFTVLIANANGIFGVYSYREVFEFERFWAIGSGRSFALGAMYARYERSRTAREVAELGVRPAASSTRTRPAPVRRSHDQVEGMTDGRDRSEGARHRRLQGRGGDRAAGQARRHA